MIAKLTLCWIAFQISFAQETETVVNEFMEATSWVPQNWKSSNSNDINNKLVCTVNEIGPYFGPLTTNVHKQFINFLPHYKLILSIDILMLGKWKKDQFVQLLIDGTTVYYNDALKSSDFTLSSSYCQPNGDDNKKLVTILVQINHTQSSLLLEIQAGYIKDEKLAIKNLVIQYLKCHQTCLTCSGPLEIQCLTCPSGTPQNGLCLCQSMVAYNHQCIANCPEYYANSNRQCQIQCCLFCTNCDQYCKECLSGYVLVNNACYLTCPVHASMINGTCIDYVDQSDFGMNQFYVGSTYLIKAAYTVSNNIIEEKQKFLLSQPLSNSILTTQTYSIYQNTLYYGGFGVWGGGEYIFTKSGLPPHSRIRIYLTTKVYNWSLARFLVVVDNATIHNITALSGTQPLTLQVTHNSENITVKLNSNLTVSSYISWISVSDIFILADQCEIGCLVCGLLNCQQCEPPLTLIFNKCILCGNDYNRNIDCSCKFGYYESNEISCFKCPIKCDSCISATQCNECNLDLKLTNYPQCDSCVDGYFMDSTCKQCNDKCSTCKSQGTCISCSNILLSPPNCAGCDTGFYYDLIIKSCVAICPLGQYLKSQQQCEICADQCTTCVNSADNCTECSTNRIFTPECNCPIGGFSRLEYQNAWCTSIQYNYLACKIGVAYAKFSDDLKMIEVAFGGRLQQLIMPSCDQLLKPTTFIQLGQEPNCVVNILNLTIYLGLNSSIGVGAKLEFNSKYLILDGCQNGFEEVKHAVVEYPNQLLQPQIILDHTSVTIPTQFDFPVEIVAEFINGQRNLQLLGWEIIKFPQTNSTTQLKLLLQLWNTQLNNSIFKIPKGSLISNQQFTLNLKYVNFLNQVSNTSITIKIVDFNAHIEYPKPPYYSDQALQFLVHIDSEGIDQKNINGNTLDLSRLSVQLNFEQLQYSNRILTQINQQFIDEFSLITIESNQLNANSLYRLRFVLIDTLSTNQVVIDEFVIQIQKRELMIKIQSTNNILGFRQLISIKGFIQFYNQSAPLETDVDYVWTCLDIINQCPCKYMNSTIITFGKSLNQTIPSKTFQPYQVIQITLKAESSQNSIVIYIIENEVPAIQLDNHESLMGTYINYYDSMMLRFNYEDNSNPDDLLYVAQLFQGTDLIGYFIFHYLQLNLQLWNHVNISQTMDKLTIKVNIHNPLFIMPSTTSINLLINVPPMNCSIKIANQEILALLTVVEVEIDSCVDQHKPLQYQFVLYHNQTELQSDYEQGILINGLILQEFSHSFKLSSVLAGGYESILMVRIKDSLEGITNMTYLLNISSTPVTVQQQLDLIILSTDETTKQLRNIMLLLQHYTYQEQNTMDPKIVAAIQDSLIHIINCCQSEYINTINIITTKLNRHIMLKQSEIITQLTQFNGNLDQLALSYLQPQNQYELFISQQAWYIYTNQLSSIFTSIQQLDYDGESINELMIDDFLSNIAKLTNIILGVQTINDNIQVLTSTEFTIKIAKFTVKLLQDQIGPLLEDDHYLGEPTHDFQNNEPYDYCLMTFKHNPYMNTSAFRSLNYNSTNQKLVYPNITGSYSRAALEIQQPARYSFDQEISLNSLKDAEITCLSLVKDTWTTEQCYVEVQQQKTNCICKMLTPVTIVQSLEQLERRALILFSVHTIESILSYRYQEILFTYIILIFTIAYIWFLFYGRTLDKHNQETTYSQTKVYPTVQVSEKTANVITDINIHTERKNSMVSVNMVPSKHNFNHDNTQDIYSDRNINLGKNLRSARLKIKSRELTDNIVMVKIKEDQILDDEIMEKQQQQSEIDQKSQRTIGLTPISKEFPRRSPPSQYKRVSILESTQRSLYLNVFEEQITLKEAFVIYFKNFHSITQLYYRYHKQSNRIHRATLLYVSILGQIAIICFFGRIIDFYTIMVMSLLQFVFGTTFKIFIAFLIHHDHKITNYIAANIVLISTLIFLFVILGSIANYQDSWVANLWAISYLGSFCLDYCIYRTINLLIVFKLLLTFAQRDKLRDILLKFLEIGTKQFFYGEGDSLFSEHKSTI